MPKSPAQAIADAHPVFSDSAHAPDQSVTYTFGHPGKPLLITFGGLRAGVGMPPYEFGRAANSLGCNTMSVRDLSQAWYQGALPGLGAGVPDLIASVGRLAAEAEASRVVCIGNCMGGYAALVVGSAIRADRVVAFVPATYFTPWLRLRHGERRWRVIARYSRRQPTAHPPSFNLRRYLAVPGWGQATLYVDPVHRLDFAHVNHIAQLPRTTVELRSGGHSLAKTLRDSGELGRIIEQAVHG